MTRFSTFFLLTILGGAGAFVVPNSNSIARPTTATTTKLNLLDPSHIFETASTFLADASDATATQDYIPGTSGEVSYSRYSYYTILGLYLFSFPGLWSTIKRSTAAKMKKKTYVRYVNFSVGFALCLYSF